MSIEQTAELHAASHPGFVLVNFAEVGLPVYRVRTRVQVTESLRIHPIEEFVLRGIELGVRTDNELGSLLGLPPQVMEATIVQLSQSEAISISSKGDASEMVLTELGRKMVVEVRRQRTREVTIDVDYDGLLRRPVPPIQLSLRPRELRAYGIREIPPAPARVPDIEELQGFTTQISSITRSLGRPEDQAREIISVSHINGSQRIFRRAVALVFRSETGRSFKVSFALGHQLSPEHENAFSEANLFEKLGIAKRGIEPASTAVKRVVGEGAVAAHRATASSQTADTQSESTTTVEQVLEGQANPTVIAVETYEHPRILEHALKNARSKVLLISPWIRSAVVDDKFIKNLTSALDRGVQVFLGWGMQSNSKEQWRDFDKPAKKQLDDLSSKFENFKFERLGSTHSKVLLCDSKYVVVTSFNWLSFRGDPKRTFRDERGTLVSESAFVEKQFQELVARFS